MSCAFVLISQAAIRNVSQKVCSYSQKCEEITKTLIKILESQLWKSLFKSLLIIKSCKLPGFTTWEQLFQETCFNGWFYNLRFFLNIKIIFIKINDTKMTSIFSSNYSLCVHWFVLFVIIFIENSRYNFFKVFCASLNQ